MGNYAFLGDNCYLRKIHGYPPFSFWIPITLLILLLPHSCKPGKTIPMLMGTFHRKPEVVGPSQDAENVCTVTEGGTVHILLHLLL